jgi:hypothetical protein
VTYELTSFHSILSLHDADKHFRSKDGLLFVETKLRSLILQHGVTNLFGVALVHCHFDLEEGIILVEKDMVTAPWTYDSSFMKYGGKIVPISWFCKEGIPRPYEFGFYPYSMTNPAKLKEYSSFVEAFFDAVNLHGLSNSVSLRRLSGHESTGMLECTEGKVNIIFLSNEVRPLISSWFIRSLIDIDPCQISSKWNGHNVVFQWPATLPHVLMCLYKHWQFVEPKPQSY